MSFVYGNWVRSRTDKTPYMVMRQVGHVLFLAGGGYIHEKDAVIVRYRDCDLGVQSNVPVVYKGA